MNKLKEDFLHAAKNGKKEEIVRAVEEGVDVNVCGYNDRNALDYVAQTENNDEIIKFLLEKGIKVHETLLTINKKAKLSEPIKALLDYVCYQQKKDEGIEVPESVLTDKKAKLSEEMKAFIDNVYNPQREERRAKLKAELRKKGPEVRFTMREDGRHVSTASVIFQGIDSNLEVSFDFEKTSVYDPSYEGQNLDLNAYINNKKVDGVRIKNRDYSDEVERHIRKGIMPQLKKAKFNGSADSINKIIAEAQKAVLKKWPDYEKKLEEERKKQEQERLAKTDEIGQYFLKEYGIMPENEENKQENAVPGKLANIREKMLKKEKKGKTPIKKAVSKLAGSPVIRKLKALRDGLGG